MKSRFRYWVIFLALMLLSPGLSRGLNGPTDQAIAILDGAIDALESKSAYWLQALEEARDNLTDSAQTAIRNEVGSALTRVIATNGTEFSRNIDFIRMWARRDPIRIKAGLSQQPIISREPSKMPWSGWWWPSGHFPPPMAAAGGPLDKFDRYIAGLGLSPTGAGSWEAINHYKPGCPWCGHCHGWAAAAILEPEPTRPVRVGMIDFTVGDLKGLLTEVHCTDAYDLIEGARDIATGTRDDELKAVVFHRVLLDWVMNGEPVIMDMTKKPMVLNHPVYRCQMTSRPDPIDPQKTHVIAALWYVSARVSPDYVGTMGTQVAYQYWVTGDFQNPSDGGWEGNSLIDHPGSAWRPAYVNHDPRRNPNPALKYYDPYILQLLNKIRGGYTAMPELEPGVMDRPIILNLSPYGMITPLIYQGLAPREPFEDSAAPAMAASRGISADGAPGAFHMRSRANFHGRQLIREGSEEDAGNAGKLYPAWSKGAWWQIQVRQRAIAATEIEVGWTQPFLLSFEIIGEEVVEDQPCYLIRVTYPDRPLSAERQYADIWVTKDKRAMLKGSLHIGDRSIPMRHHFLTELMKAAHQEVNADGEFRSSPDPKRPDQKVELRAFEARSPYGGSSVSSLAPPFPSRIEKPTYIAELTDWGF
jgi:transglutaminase elicitor